MQPVERLGRDVERGHEAEGQLGAGEIVVDGLRHADDGHAARVELLRDAERALASEHDEPVDLLAAQVLNRLAETLVGPHVAFGLVHDEPATVARAEDRAAARQ